MKLYQHEETGTLVWSRELPSARHYQIPTMYEDELPDMNDKDYAWWFDNSYVDFVRIGPVIK